MPQIVEAHPGVATSRHRPVHLGPAYVGDVTGARCARRRALLVGRNPLAARPAAGRTTGRNRLIDDGCDPPDSENPLPYNPKPPHPDEVFQAFVRELASCAQPDLLARLKQGHTPDEQGWCRHTAHEHHWEHHPCTSLRLALLAEVQRRADQAGCDPAEVPAQRESPAVATPPSR